MSEQTETSARIAGQRDDRRSTAARRRSSTRRSPAGSPTAPARCCSRSATRWGTRTARRSRPPVTRPRTTCCAPSWPAGARPTRCSPRRTTTRGWRGRTASTTPYARTGSAPPGSGSSTRWTAPGSSPRRAAPTGPCTWRSGPPTVPGPSCLAAGAVAMPAQHRTLATDHAAGVPAAAAGRRDRRADPDRGEPHPAAGVRHRAGRGHRRRAGADGLGRGEDRRGDQRRRRRLRARRRAVRVGLAPRRSLWRWPPACTLPESTDLR